MLWEKMWNKFRIEMLESASLQILQNASLYMVHLAGPVGYMNNDNTLRSVSSRCIISNGG